jgi:hypothetical protein
MTVRRMEKLNAIKRIVNGKNCYIDKNNIKTNIRYIPELRETSQTEVVVRGGMNCGMSNPCCAVMCYTCCNVKNEY